MNHHPIKALIVESDSRRSEHVQRLLASSLSFAPICGEAKTLSEGLSFCQSEIWDVIITRLNLPDSKGLEALVRFHLLRQDVPVIVLLEDEEQEVVLDAAQSLADDCLFLNDLDSARLIDSVACVLDRRELLMELKARQARSSDAGGSPFERLLDHLDEAVFVVSRPEGELLYSNAVAKAWFGDRSEESVADFLEYGLLEGEDLEIEISTSHAALPNAELRSACLDWKGQPACMLKLRNISKRKRAEDAFLSSQRRLDLALKASNIGLWSWDLRAGQMQFSDRWKALLGYESAEFSDTLQAFRAAMHPDDRRRVAEYFKRYFREPWAEFEIEYRMRRRDGTYAAMLCRAELYSDSDGALSKVMGSHIDVTERGRTNPDQGWLLEESPPAKEIVAKPASPLALVADDDDVLRGAICTMLENFGYETIVAADGSQALQRFAEKGSTLAVALLDCNMPGLDGGEVYRRIRQTNHSLPVLLMSGNEDELSMELDGPEFARCRFLNKPFGMESLRRTLADMLASAPGEFASDRR